MDNGQFSQSAGFLFQMVALISSITGGCTSIPREERIKTGQFDSIRQSLNSELKEGQDLTTAEEIVRRHGLRQRINVDSDTIIHFVDARGPLPTTFRLQVELKHANGRVTSWQDSVIGTGL